MQCLFSCFSQIEYSAASAKPFPLPVSERIEEQLAKAILDENFNQVKEVVSLLDLKSIPSGGSQFLSSSIKSFQIFQFLLQSGFNPHQMVPGSNETPYRSVVKLKLIKHLEEILKFDENYAFSEEYDDFLKKLYSQKIDDLAQVKFNIETDGGKLAQYIEYFKRVDPNYPVHSALYVAIDCNNVEMVKACLTIGVNPAELIYHGGNIFFLAVERGNLEILKIIVEAFQQQNPSKNILLEHYNGNSPLTVCAKLKNTNVLSYLFSLMGNDYLPHCLQAIRICLEDGYCDMVELFATKIDLSTLFFSDGTDLLGTSVKYNQKEMISFLLKKQFNPNRVMPNGYTPIEYAVYLKKDDLVFLMRQGNLNPNTSRDFSLLPDNFIHIGIEDGHSRMKSAQKQILEFITTRDVSSLESIVSFRQNMANLGCLDWYPPGRNATLLQTAVRYGRNRIVGEFLSIQNKSPLQQFLWTAALFDAVDVNNFSIFCLIYEKLCQVYGAPVPFPNNEISPFSLAAKNNRLDFIRYLLDKNPPKNEGEWAFHIIQAFKWKLPDVFQVFAEKIDFKIFTIKGKDFIQFCIEIGRIDVVKIIFEPLFIQTEVNKLLKNPKFLMTVVKEGHYNSFDFLLDHGADIDCYTPGEETPYEFIIKKRLYLLNLLSFKRRQPEAIKHANSYLAKYQQSPEGTLLLGNVDTKLPVKDFVQIMFLQKIGFLTETCLKLLVKQHHILITPGDRRGIDPHKVILILPEILGKGAYGSVKKTVNLFSGLFGAQKTGDSKSLDNEIKNLRILHSTTPENPLGLPCIGIQACPDRDCLLEVSDIRSSSGFKKSYRTILYDGTIDSEASIQFLRANPQKVTKITKQILTGLEIAKEKNIVHKDIKPDNIFVLFIRNEDGLIVDIDAYLGDWGLSDLANNRDRYLKRKNGYYSPYDMYQAEETLKTKRSEALDQVLREINFKSDIYALGVSLDQIFSRVMEAPTAVVSAGADVFSSSQDIINAPIKCLISKMRVTQYQHRLNAVELLKDPVFA